LIKTTWPPVFANENGEPFWKDTMTDLDRRKLLHAGVGLAIPIGIVPLLAGCQPTESKSTDDVSSAIGRTEGGTVQDPNDDVRMTRIQYLEIVTTEVDTLCAQYSAVHGITFGEPVVALGGARTAKLEGGGSLGIRGPLRDNETPVVRPYVLVDDIEAAVAAAADAGAATALPPTELSGHGTCAIVIQGGIECGLWQL
jgi:predicted enzyme related to lactoylglutathione lyase